MSAKGIALLPSSYMPYMPLMADRRSHKRSAGGGGGNGGGGNLPRNGQHSGQHPSRPGGSRNVPQPWAWAWGGTGGRRGGGDRDAPYWRSPMDDVLPDVDWRSGGVAGGSAGHGGAGAHFGIGAGAYSGIGLGLGPPPATPAAAGAGAAQLVPGTAIRAGAAAAGAGAAGAMGPGGWEPLAGDIAAYLGVKGDKAATAPNAEITPVQVRRRGDAWQLGSMIALPAPCLSSSRPLLYAS